MITKILVAIDGSSHSRKAVEFASQIAAALKAKLLLLYVVKHEAIPDAMRQFAKAEHLPDSEGDLAEMLKRGAQMMLENTAKEARSAGVTDIDIEVKDGPIARTIVARSEHHDIDMIVVGSRGMGDIEGLLRGGVSHRVELLAKCPVLVVK